MSEHAEQATVKETIFDVIIEMLYIAFVFLIPVIFNRRIGIVFSGTKQTTIRIIVILIIVVWVLKLLFKNKHIFVRSPLDWPVATYMLACTVATVTSVHVITSFMGFYGRYEGLVTLWSYGFLYLLTINFIRRREQIRRVFYTVIAAGVFMSIYSIIQRAKLDPYAWGGVLTWSRVIGTIGQPNFLAAYVTMAFIIGLAVLINLHIRKLDDANKNIIVSRVLNSTIIVSIVLIYVCILFTQSRGGFLGLMAGTILFFSLINRNLILNNWKKLSIVFFLIFIVSFITMLNPDLSPISRMAGEAKIIEETHEQETPIIKYSAALSRLETWKSGYRLMTAYPFFGIGQEVLKMIFPQFETEYFRFYEGFHVKQDRMHNEICDMAVTRGIPTLFIYVWMFAVFFWIGSKIMMSDRDSETKLFAAAILGAVVSYIIQNQFSFGVVAITSLLWILIGLLASIYNGEPAVEKEEFHLDLSKFPWLYVSIILIVAGYLMHLSTIQFRADKHFKNGKVLAKMGRYDQAAVELEKSIKISPYEGGQWTHYGISVLNIAQKARRKNLLDRSIAIFSKATEIDPYNADNFYIMGRAYLIKSIYDKEALNKAIEVERKALLIDPRYAEAYQIIANIYGRQGKNDEAFKEYIEALKINPSLSQSTQGLLAISARRGNFDEVINVFEELLIKYPNNLLYLENLGLAYVKKGDIKKGLKTYNNMLDVDPKNLKALSNTGFLLAQMGKIKDAKDKFNQIVIIDPKNVDAHNGLGLIYLKLGNTNKAKEEFKQSLMIDPNNQYAKKMMENIK